jgi:exo-beta-1,3-glucanase (GH17 family)
MRRLVWMIALCLSLIVPALARADEPRFALFDLLTDTPSPKFIAYTPSRLDPRQEANQRALPTSTIRADLEALRPSFDGLVLYGYHEAVTPRIAALAKELKFRAVLLAVWDPKSAAEVDGVVEVVRIHSEGLALGVLLGNEGLTFKRYETDDLRIAADRLHSRIGRAVPFGTSEPLGGYESAFVREFGDFLAPNIHPVFDRPNLGPAEAASWAREQAGQLARRAKKPVIVKETGFPHAGKPAYSPESQAAFWSAYLKPGLLAKPVGSPWVFHGVAFEAFDLHWKATESKLAIEASWGLLSTERRPYTALRVWREHQAARR